MGAPGTPRGLVIAAPSSGSGKTFLTLGVLRALKNRGVAVSSAKVGPDYIDPVFHAVAIARPSENLDIWAMRPETLTAVASRMGEGADLIVCEGVMGLFDGATASEGSTADLAAHFGWPVILVVDVRAQAASAAAIVQGFSNHRDDIIIGGVIFNNVGSDRHRQIIGEAMALHMPDLPVLGYVSREPALSLPSRHLGLVQAEEHDDLDGFLDRAARHVERDVNLDALTRLAAAGTRGKPDHNQTVLPALGQRIAVARDTAFAFCYDHVLHGWRAAGAEISFFSPLANETPDAAAAAIYLPGGYPELHAETLANAGHFLRSLRDAAARGIAIYGECGGYMVLGKKLQDADGTFHGMAGLLPLATSFANRKLHLGYRRVTCLSDTILGKTGQCLNGHEFHYARIISEDKSLALFQAEAARGQDLGPMGMSKGSVAGSFFHLIDQAA